MFRKMLIGLATITAIGIASMPMNASARGGHGDGGFHGGGGAFHGGMAMRGPTGGGFGATRLLPCPAEQASAECLAEASTLTISTITTSATSSRSGSSRLMLMRTIRTMIATTWCGCERIMAGGGGMSMFAAELCGLDCARDGGVTRSENDGDGRGTRSKGLR